uniref:Putative 56.5 kDa secreted protein 56k-3 n=1 Tax=Aedes albopictus TaxID=7160 RepID=Q5MIU6_AEDAL|nr:putative 56.5 kDa secreted protein 56k-3 [Aedes albopictus]
MLRLAAISLLLIASVLSEPRPDLAVPVTIPGVSSGSLDTNGNIVANADRILATLNQFQSIVQSLYYIKTPEYAEVADNFRYVMDSLVEAGSPIFQGLSNVAKISSGNIERAFNGIRSDINYTIDLHEEHMSLVNASRDILGDATTAYFEGALTKLFENLNNITSLLNNIQGAVVQIQQLNPRTQAAVNALLPNSDIKALNAVLRQYIQIADSAIPGIRSVVSRIQTVDSLNSRITTSFEQYRQSLNTYINRTSAPYLQSNVINTLVNGLANLRKQLVERTSKDGVSVATLMFDSNSILGDAANRTVPVLQALALNISTNFDALENLVKTLRMATDRPHVVLNMTERALNAVIRETSLVMTQRRNRSDSCFAQVNNLFDAIPRNVYPSLSNCLYNTVSDGSAMVSTMNYATGSTRNDMNYELAAVEGCVNMITRYSTDMTKYQAATCLSEARNFISGRRVYVQQIANYQKLLENEVAYSAGRYDYCLANSMRQAQTMINYLRGTFGQCVGMAPAVTPYKFRIGGKVTIRFG